MSVTANHEVVVVAIPQEDDYTWKVSSEKIPHMTLLYLGDVEVSQHIAEYVQHAASLLEPFGMTVDRRGKLGPKDADVLFFDEGYMAKRVDNFRGQLLADTEIFSAYQMAPQFPQWTPHLTLGFPEKPAKPMNREYGFNYVQFDRIAIWDGDSEGPTFQLKNNSRFGLEVAMSTEFEDVLEHYGVKGMKWGQHRRSSRQTEPNSHDSARVGEVVGRVKTQKTTRILTNAELKDAIERMRLEQEFSKITGGVDKTSGQKAKAFVAKMLIDTGKQTATQAVNTKAKSLVDEQLKKARV
jgi:2'-5' RNA ligase